MDTLSAALRSERMARVRGKDTKPELTVRRMLHASGFRYRLHRSDLPGGPDICLPNFKSIIFVHGCFWHRHPSRDCRLARMPKSRQEFLAAKFASNVVRDARDQERLLVMGWNVLVVWECELRHPGDVVARLKKALSRE